MVQMQEPDCFLRYRISAGTWNFTSGKYHVYVYSQPAAAARHGFRMVLFTEPLEHLSRRYMCSTECPSSLIIYCIVGLLFTFVV